MLKSMTGFGKSSAENENISVDFELKSVNSRFLDIFFRLPNFLSIKEFELKDVIKKRINRGKISVSLQVNFKNPKDSPWGINTDKLNDFLLTVKEIKEQSNIDEKLKLNDLLLNKDLFTGNKIEISSKDFEFIKGTLNKAIDELNVMKTNEGSELADDLQKRTKEIEFKVEEINKHARDSVVEYHSLLKERIKNLYKSNSVSQQKYDEINAKYNLAFAQFNSAKEQYQKIKNGARPEEIKQVKANLEKARANLDIIKQHVSECYVTAPQNGFIVKKFVEIGENVPPFGSLFKVSDLSKVNLVIYVSERELGKVKLGQTVEVKTDTYPNKIYKGTVTYISPEAEFTPKSVQTKDERTKLVFAVKIEIPNDNSELKAGMPADAEIKLAD